MAAVFVLPLVGVLGRCLTARPHQPRQVRRYYPFHDKPDPSALANLSTHRAVRVDCRTGIPSWRLDGWHGLAYGAPRLVKAALLKAHDTLSILLFLSRQHLAGSGSSKLERVAARAAEGRMHSTFDCGGGSCDGAGRPTHVEEPACGSFRGIRRVGPRPLPDGLSLPGSHGTRCPSGRGPHAGDFRHRLGAHRHVPGSIDTGHLAASDRLHEIHRRPAVGPARSRR